MWVDIPKWQGKLLIRYCLSAIVVLSIFTICLPLSTQHPDTVGIWLFDEGVGDEAADSSGNEHTAGVQIIVDFTIKNAVIIGLAFFSQFVYTEIKFVSRVPKKVLLSFEI